MAEEAQLSSQEGSSDIDISGRGRIISEHEGTSPATSCAVFPDIAQMALGWSNGTIEIRCTRTFQETMRLRTTTDLPATFLSPYLTRRGEKLLLASFASGDTVMWNIEIGDEVWRVTEERQSLVNGFSCDYTKFAVGGSDAKINVYDVGNQAVTQVLQGSMDPEVMDGHTQRIFSLRFHPFNANELISGGWDDTVQFWDIREPFSNRKIRGPHICGDGIEFLDENRFVTASWTKKNPLQVWDYRSTKFVENINPDHYTCFLYCCRYIEAESLLLAGGSHENMLKVIQMGTSTSLASFRELHGAVYFAKELPKQDPTSLKSNICFCSDKTVYLAEVETF